MTSVALFFSPVFLVTSSHSWPEALLLKENELISGAEYASISQLLPRRIQESSRSGRNLETVFIRKQRSYISYLHWRNFFLGSKVSMNREISEVEGMEA